MDLTIAREDLEFRDEVRHFLDANVPAGLQRKVALTTAFLTEPDIARDFHKALHKKGWSVFNWPAEYGGPGWSAVQRYIFDTECARYDAPMYNGAGRVMLAPVLMKFGRQDQKDFYLPRIAAGDDHWAQGYSEPGAGSDLASLKTKAESDGDHYIVNGQKIWTTQAHKSNRIFALVRTSSEGKRQEGITFLLIDMDTPGITVRPIVGNGGDHEFNEVFFDNVRVPKSNRVGEENKGWDCAKYLLEFERGGSLVAGRVRAQFTRLVEQVKGLCPNDHDIAIRLAELGTDLDAMEMIDISVLSKLQSGGNPGPISSLLKMRWSQIRQQIAELAMDAVGEEALKWIAARPLYATLQLPADEEEILAATPRYLNYRAYSIFGGSTEIQTTIMAKSLLGL
ncbi:MAG TPA: acyl-CoA dehydrogenase family protein [Stellaceae bacterium]|jgi:acyl-CoA dehydrogenase|nr:acyl-CoA dehydrogenase family protein [Stellaceae bacterium]